MKNKKKFALLTIVFAVFTDMLIYGIIVPILPEYSATIGISQTQIGLIFSSYAVALFIATPILGTISDKYGRRAPMLLGTIGMVLSLILFIFTTNLWILILARIIQGGCAAITWTAGLAYLADSHPPEERGKAMGISLSGQAAGTLLGPVFGGWIFQLGSFEILFLFAICINLIDGVFRFLYVKDVTGSKTKNVLSSFGILKDRQLLIVTSIVVIGACIPTVLQPTLPLHLQNTLNTNPGAIGLLFAVPTLAYGLTTPILGIVSGRIGNMKTIIIGLILISVSLPLVVLPNSMLPQIAALALLGVSMGAVLVPCLAHLANISQSRGENSYGLTFAIYNTAYSIGMIIGPMLSSSLAEAVGVKLSYIFIGCVVLIYMIFISIILSRGILNNNNNIQKSQDSSS
ncbi:Multidrug resistance protein [Evansella caseinilytica]|uniref:Multidrug resistance protein n=1 Tax=Evansella caseinilytica TaxID=1503961 RepID=A0A1H3PWX1_9BACI|nr:MFS transporter [Evansella caseinilytica]SDZ05804.1 Multidrug resistance protein [Evansella caseinilytica]